MSARTSAAFDPRLDRLWAKMEVIENADFTRDYLEAIPVRDFMYAFAI